MTEPYQNGRQKVRRVPVVLDKIEKDGTEEFLTCLEAWKLMEVKKVAARIAEVENTIKNRAKLSE